MRGKQDKQVTMLCALTPDQLVPLDHPIREIKPIVDRALSGLSATFNRMYAEVGRPSIPPEHLLKASLLIALYSIRSERQFCERLQYDLLFKWFLDLNIMDPAFDASTFSKNKERLLEHRVAREFLGAVVAEARRRQLLSDDHFTVDGTLLEAGASLKSFRSKDGDDKEPGSHRITVAVDKGYDTQGFVTACRDMNVTLHVARQQWSTVDKRTTRHAGYQVSQRVRKRVEEIFGGQYPSCG